MGCVDEYYIGSSCSCISTYMLSSLNTKHAYTGTMEYGVCMCIAEIVAAGGH